MKLLAFDTTTDTSSVALFENGHVISEVQISGRKNSSRLIEETRQLIERAGWSVKQLEGVAVAEGPGSFTGVRTGMSSAKAIAYGLSIPLYAVSSLQAIACNAVLLRAHPEELEGHYICAMMDARNRQVYAALYKYEGGKLTEFVNSEGNIQYPSANDVDLFIAENERLKIDPVYAGDGAVAYIPDKVSCVRNYPGAIAVAVLASPDNQANPITAVPEYMRKTQAERMRACSEKTNT